MSTTKWLHSQYKVRNNSGKTWFLFFMRGLIFIIVLALVNITIGISYPNWCDTGVMVLAEEEERSTEHGEEDIAAQLSDYIISPSPETDKFRFVENKTRWFHDNQATLPPGNFNLHDIPPEV